MTTYTYHRHQSCDACDIKQSRGEGRFNNCKKGAAKNSHLLAPCVTTPGMAGKSVFPPVKNVASDI